MPTNSSSNTVAPTYLTKLNYQDASATKVVITRGWVYLETEERLVWGREILARPTQLRTFRRWVDLTELDLSNNPLGSLPFLPTNLERLVVFGCDLSHLPDLPPRIREVLAAENRLVVLPDLPRSTRTLDVRRCQLTHLPGLSRLRELVVAMNPLEEFPRTIPASMRFIDARECLLDSLPTLPSTLDEVRFHGNPFARGVDREHVPYLLRSGIPCEAYETYEARLAAKD